MRHLVWPRAGRWLLARGAHSNSLLQRTSEGTGQLTGGEQHFAGWVTSWFVLACGWGGRERPDTFLAHLHSGPKSDSVETVCRPCALTSEMPNSPLLSRAMQQGQVSILSGFGGLSEMHQKKHSLWKVVWRSHKKRFIALLSSSWAGVTVRTFSFSLSPFQHLTVRLLPGAWEPRGW